MTKTALSNKGPPLKRGPILRIRSRSAVKNAGVLIWMYVSSFRICLASRHGTGGTRNLGSPCASWLRGRNLCPRGAPSIWGAAWASSPSTSPSTAGRWSASTPLTALCGLRGNALLNLASMSRSFVLMWGVWTERALKVLLNFCLTLGAFTPCRRASASSMCIVSRV